MSAYLGEQLAAERQDDGLVPTLMTHLDEDPYELHNLAEDPAVADRRIAMLARLTASDQELRGPMQDAVG